MSKPFNWMEHLGFEVQDAGGVPVINEEGDMREADLCHRVLWDEMVSLKAQRDVLIAELNKIIVKRGGAEMVREGIQQAIQAYIAASEKGGA